MCVVEAGRCSRHCTDASYTGCSTQPTRTPHAQRPRERFRSSGHLGCGTLHDARRPGCNANSGTSTRSSAPPNPTGWSSTDGGAARRDRTSFDSTLFAIRRRSTCVRAAVVGDAAPGAGVEGEGEEEPAFAGFDAGKITLPDQARTIRCGHLGQPVLHDGMSVAAVCSLAYNLFGA